MLAFDQATVDNGGAQVLSYKLYRDVGGSPLGSGDIDILVTGYDGQASQHKVTGLTANAVYRFQYVATNAFGDSPGSAILSVAACNLPGPPGAPYVDWSLSGRTSLFMRWVPPIVTPPDAAAYGYRLEMDDGNGTFITKYDGQYKPGVHAHLVDGLVNGHYYKFRALALDYNGNYSASPNASFYACTAPAEFVAPLVTSQTSTTMVLEWAPPEDTGGCSITGYAVFRDGGSVAGTALDTEFNSANDANVRNKPSLRALTATHWPAGTVGQSFRLQVQVFTTQRDALSAIAYALLASVPAAPTDIPVSDASITNDTTIRVTYASPPPADGGSALLSYELQMDDGLGGDFVTLVGYTPNTMVTHYTVPEGILKGRVHRFRYRAKNSVGWGPYSEEASILPATVPSAPARTAYANFSGSTLYVTIGLSADDGGSPILGMELLRDAGDDFTSAFQTVTNYDGQSLTYGFTVATDGMVAGKTYRITTRTRNLIGYSAYSTVTYVAFGPLPGAPGQPQRVGWTRTSLTVRWTAPALAASDLPLLGYVLNMDDGLNKDLKPVYVGMHIPDITEYTAGGLTTGFPYLFSVQAINRNGYSVHSATATYYACVAPPVVGTPTQVSTDHVAKAITIEWRKPTDNGGCSILGYRLYRTDGSSDRFDQTTPGVLVATLTATNPSITQHTIDLSSGTIGHIYKFMLEAYNYAGATNSSSLFLALASWPSTPSVLPASIPTLTGPT